MRAAWDPPRFDGDEVGDGGGVHNSVRRPGRKKEEKKKGSSEARRLLRCSVTKGNGEGRCRRKQVQEQERKSSSRRVGSAVRRYTCSTDRVCSPSLTAVRTPPSLGPSTAGHRFHCYASKQAR